MGSEKHQSGWDILGSKSLLELHEMTWVRTTFTMLDADASARICGSRLWGRRRDQSEGGPWSFGPSPGN